MDNIKEEWKVIDNFPNYAVSNMGRVKRVARGPNTYPGKILKPFEVAL